MNGAARLDGLPLCVILYGRVHDGTVVNRGHTPSAVSRCVVPYGREGVADAEVSRPLPICSDICSRIPRGWGRPATPLLDPIEVVVHVRLDRPVGPLHVLQPATRVVPIPHRSQVRIHDLDSPARKIVLDRPSDTAWIGHPHERTRGVVPVRGGDLASVLSEVDDSHDLPRAVPNDHSPSLGWTRDGRHIPIV